MGRGLSTRGPSKVRHRLGNCSSTGQKLGAPAMVLGRPGPERRPAGRSQPALGWGVARGASCRPQGIWASVPSLPGAGRGPEGKGTLCRAPPPGGAWHHCSEVLNFLVLSLARPVLVPEIKEVVSHKYKTPMVSVPPAPQAGLQRAPRALQQEGGGPRRARGDAVVEASVVWRQRCRWCGAGLLARSSLAGPPAGGREPPTWQPSTSADGRAHACGR